FLGTTCHMEALGPLVQPRLIDGIVELPISFYSDYPNHFRHVQLCACSFSELREALLWAWRDGWYSFVIVLHSAELIRNKDRPGEITPDRLLVSRFDRLCRFLSENKDKFKTAHFHELNPDMIPTNDKARWFQSSFARTLGRYGEQLVAKF